MRITTLPFLLVLFIASTSFAQDAKADKKTEPHRYGGWYCPDNFGFVPVDIQKLKEVPAISNRLPTEQELSDNMSLIRVDTEKYPDARALEMDLPRVARIYSGNKGMSELIIVIQAIVVSNDTVVGYRFPNGGNGSAWLSDVTFLSDDEVVAYGSQPFYYSSTVVNATEEDIWQALCKTDYFKSLGKKFDREYYFSSKWKSETRVHMERDTDNEKAIGWSGILFGNFYLHIDYDLDGFHYSEKLLMTKNQEDNTTTLYFASGPFPDDYETQKDRLDEWILGVKHSSESK